MISTKGRYALRVMIDLAEHNDGSFIPLKETAARQEISKKYLEIIVKTLVAANLINGANGRNGGYRLSRQPEEYCVGEIIELAEGGLSPVACLAPDAEECPRRGLCKTLPLWEEYNELVHNFFYSKKLSDLL